jgi:threonine/homoserine/homoserine lactone efflux protein
MAWRTLQESGPLSVEADAAPRSDRQVIVDAVLVNLLNPKLSIFFFAFLPQFVSGSEASPLYRMLELSLVFMAMTFAVFAVYGVFAAALRREVLARPCVMTLLRWSFAGAFALLGLKLAAAER